MNELAPTIVDEIQKFIATNPKGVVILRGATATGKSSMSLELATQLPIEIISADSRQVYVGMDIGTDKVSKENREKVVHHLIDIVPPDHVYTAGQRKQQATQIVEEIHERGNIPLIVGGTGLYIDTLYKNFSMPEVEPQEQRRQEMMKLEESHPGFIFEQLQKVDPEEARKHHPNSLRYVLRALEIYHVTGTKKSASAHEQPVKRPLLMIGLRREKEDTNRRINKRIKEMLNGGLIEEVQSLISQGYGTNVRAMEGIGYKEVMGYIQGEYDLNRTEELLKRNTHHYAKRQRSWFRRYIAEGKMKPKENVTYGLYTLGEGQM